MSVATTEETPSLAPTETLVEKLGAAEDDLFKALAALENVQHIVLEATNYEGPQPVSLEQVGALIVRGEHCKAVVELIETALGVIARTTRVDLAAIATAGEMASVPLYTARGISNYDDDFWAHKP